MAGPQSDGLAEGAWLEPVACGRCRMVVGYVRHAPEGGPFVGLDAGGSIVGADRRIDKVRQALRRRHPCGESPMMGAGRGSHGGVASDPGGAAGHHGRD